MSPQSPPQITNNKIFVELSNIPAAGREGCYGYGHVIAHSKHRPDGREDGEQYQKYLRYHLLRENSRYHERDKVTRRVSIN